MATDFNQEIEANSITAIKSALREFEIVFSAELPNLATYFVDQKGIYPTKDLIENAENMENKSSDWTSVKSP